MKRISFILFITIVSQSCINQKVTQSDVFNPVKEFELNDEFAFERKFIKNSDTSELETWYIKESNPELNLIYLSGNGSNIRSAIPFFNELGRQLNLNIFSFNYSGYGLSDGEPSIDGIINDGLKALDYFEDVIGDQNLPTVILGYSLGGFVSLNLVNHDAIDKVVVMSTFTSLEELQDYLIKDALPGIVRPFLNLDIDESIYKLNNLELVQKSDKAILFIHGKEDKFIPPEMSYKLYNLSNSDKKDIKIIDDADHRTILKDYSMNKKAISAIKEFIVE